MKKVKNMLKKGGVADIVTLMIIIGLVIALIITVVLPAVRNSNETGRKNVSGLHTITDQTDELIQSED